MLPALTLPHARACKKPVEFHSGCLSFLAMKRMPCTLVELWSSFFISASTQSRTSALGLLEAAAAMACCRRLVVPTPLAVIDRAGAAGDALSRDGGARRLRRTHCHFLEDLLDARG